jgi:hypothetical protein
MQGCGAVIHERRARLMAQNGSLGLYELKSGTSGIKLDYDCSLQLFF